MKPNTVMKKGRYATLEEIKATGVEGNAFSDMPSIWACESIITDRCDKPIDMKTRMETMDYLHNEIMGLNLPAVTEQDIIEYTAEVKSMDHD